MNTVQWDKYYEMGAGAWMSFLTSDQSPRVIDFGLQITEHKNSTSSDVVTVVCRFYKLFGKEPETAR